MASGLSVAQTCVLSLLMFTGASQFALVGVLGAGGSASRPPRPRMLLGTRNTLYGLRVRRCSAVAAGAGSAPRTC